MGEPHALLLARRVRREDVVVGRAYVIHARNGGVGVAVEEEGRLGYLLHREKFGRHFLFTELDWSEGPPFGTAIPLSLILTAPPTVEAELLGWLSEQEAEHRATIDAAWGDRFFDDHLRRHHRGHRLREGDDRDRESLAKFFAAIMNLSSHRRA